MTRNIGKTNPIGMPDALIASESEYNVIVISAFHNVPHGIQGAELCLTPPFTRSLADLFLPWNSRTLS